MPWLILSLILSVPWYISTKRLKISAKRALYIRKQQPYICVCKSAVPHSAEWLILGVCSVWRIQEKTWISAKRALCMYVQVCRASFCRRTHSRWVFSFCILLNHSGWVLRDSSNRIAYYSFCWVTHSRCVFRNAFCRKSLSRHSMNPRRVLDSF